MNILKSIFIGLFCFQFLFVVDSGFNKLYSEDEKEILIPEDAHSKAIDSLKKLGAERGAIKLESRTVQIIGIVKGLEAKSEKIKGTLKDLGAKENQMQIEINLPGDVLFDFDKWDIRVDAESTLQKVADIIKAYKSPRVTITGHTDSKGSDDYNLKLSLKRAESVRNWLSGKGCILPEIMDTNGLGETKPIAANENPDGTDNSEGRQKNRRVEILIKK